MQCYMIWSSRRWSPLCPQVINNLLNLPRPYHITLQNKVRRFRLYLLHILRGLGAFVNRTASYLWTYNHNNDQIIDYFISLAGPPLKMQCQLLRERQTRASHIYGTSRMSVVKLVSRKRTRKVGPGRFIPQCRDINKYTLEGNKCRIDAHIQYVF